YFAELADAHVGAGQRTTDRVGISRVVALQGDQRPGFGGAVDLLQVDAERTKEAECVATQWRPAGEAPARIPEAQLVAHGTVHQTLAHLVGQLEPGADGLAVALQQLAPLG